MLRSNVYKYYYGVIAIFVSLKLLVFLKWSPYNEELDQHPHIIIDSKHNPGKYYPRNAVSLNQLADLPISGFVFLFDTKIDAWDFIWFSITIDISKNTF